LPITSGPPTSGAGVIAIPDGLKPRMGLDRARPAYVMLDEANMFTWPGFDLVPQPDGSFTRGMITRGLFERIRAAVRAQSRPQAINRD
jgi:hypothetical protein